MLKEKINILQFYIVNLIVQAYINLYLKTYKYQREMTYSDIWRKKNINCNESSSWRNIVVTLANFLWDRK